MQAIDGLAVKAGGRDVAPVLREHPDRVLSVATSDRGPDVEREALAVGIREGGKEVEGALVVAEVATEGVFDRLREVVDAARLGDQLGRDDACEQKRAVD